MKVTSHEDATAVAPPATLLQAAPESRVGQQEQVAPMTGAVPIDHRGQHGHPHGDIAWFQCHNLDAQQPGGRVGLDIARTARSPASSATGALPRVTLGPNITLPLAALADLVVQGWVGSAVDEHVSVMGYQGWHDDALDRWRDETAPAVVRELQAQGADGLILAPA